MYLKFFMEEKGIEYIFLVFVGVGECMVDLLGEMLKFVLASFEL